MSVRLAKGNGVGALVLVPNLSVGVCPSRGVLPAKKYIVWELHLLCQFRGSGFVREVAADIVGPPSGFDWRIRVLAPPLRDGYGRSFDFIQNHFDVNCVEVRYRA